MLLLDRVSKRLPHFPTNGTRPATSLVDESISIHSLSNMGSFSLTATKRLSMPFNSASFR